MNTVFLVSFYDIWMVICWVIMNETSPPPPPPHTHTHTYQSLDSMRAFSFLWNRDTQMVCVVQALQMVCVVQGATDTCTEVGIISGHSPECMWECKCSRDSLWTLDSLLPAPMSECVDVRTQHEIICRIHPEWVTVLMTFQHMTDAKKNKKKNRMKNLCQTRWRCQKSFWRIRVNAGQCAFNTNTFPAALLCERPTPETPEDAIQACKVKTCFKVIGQLGLG